jgi:hypothetical protein
LAGMRYIPISEVFASRTCCFHTESHIQLEPPFREKVFVNQN